MENILYPQRPTQPGLSDRQAKQIQTISCSTNCVDSPQLLKIQSGLSLFLRPMQRIRLIPGPELKLLTVSGMIRGELGTIFGLMGTTTTRSLILTRLMLELRQIYRLA